MKVSFACWPSKAEGGTAPLYLIVRHRSDRATKRLPFDLKLRDWNEGSQRVRKTHRHHHKINKYLSELDARCEDVRVDMVTSGEPLRSGVVIDRAMGSDDRADFLAFYDGVIERLRGRGQWGTAEVYRVVRDKLAGYRSIISMDDLTVSFLEGFQTHLIREHGNGPTTVEKNMSTVRAVLYRAIKEGLFPQEKNPFFQISLKRDKTKRKKYLTAAEFETLKEAKLSGRAHDVRNAFVFAVYSAGMRVGDMLTLKGSDIVQRGDSYRIEYMMGKTGKESESIQLLPPAEKILREYGWPGVSGYIFPFLSGRLSGRDAFLERKRKTAILNKYLRQLSRDLDFDIRMTTHVARHTFSNILDEADLPIQRIQDLLRHSDPQTTRIYLQSLGRGKHDEVMRQVFGL